MAGTAAAVALMQPNDYKLGTPVRCNLLGRARPGRSGRSGHLLWRCAVSLRRRGSAARAAVLADVEQQAEIRRIVTGMGLSMVLVTTFFTAFVSLPFVNARGCCRRE